MIKVTEQAKAEVQKLMKADGYNSLSDYIRVGVKSGGCSGLSYNLKFDKIASPNDKVFQDNGVKIIVDNKSFLYLIGTTLEFSGGLNGKGFTFNNPNDNTIDTTPPVITSFEIVSTSISSSIVSRVSISICFIEERIRRITLS